MLKLCLNMEYAVIYLTVFSFCGICDLVQILLNGDYKVKDGGLVGEYKAIRMDFHWGKDEQNGSEHLINDTRYPMEVNFSTPSGGAMVSCYDAGHSTVYCTINLNLTTEPDLPPL